MPAYHEYRCMGACTHAHTLLHRIQPAKAPALHSLYGWSKERKFGILIGKSILWGYQSHDLCPHTTQPHKEFLIRMIYVRRKRKKLILSILDRKILVGHSWTIQWLASRKEVPLVLSRQTMIRFCVTQTSLTRLMPSQTRWTQV